MTMMQKGNNMRYVFSEGLNAVICPKNFEFYLQVNPRGIEVRKCRGGWKPVDPKRWGGQIPIKAKLVVGTSSR